MQQPQHNYRPYLGLAYAPPFGCFQLVRRVYEELYGITIKDVKQITHQVTTPLEGDVVLIRGSRWHVGLVIAPGEMLHCYNGGTSCVEDYTGPLWRNRVVGFYRYSG